MSKEDYCDAAKELNARTDIPHHPKWKRQMDLGEYGAAVYWYSDWDVGPEDYGGDPDEYSHISDSYHGFSVELSNAQDGGWHATFASPTRHREFHQPDKTKSVSGVSLDAAIQHVEKLLAETPEE